MTPGCMEDDDCAAIQSRIFFSIAVNLATVCFRNSPATVAAFI